MALRTEAEWSIKKIKDISSDDAGFDSAQPAFIVIHRH